MPPFDEAAFDAALQAKLDTRPDLYRIEAVAVAFTWAVVAVGLILLVRFFFLSRTRREPIGAPDAGWTGGQVVLLLVAFVALPFVAVQVAPKLGLPEHKGGMLPFEYVVLIVACHAVVALLALGLAVATGRGLRALGLPGPQPLAAIGAGLVAYVGTFPLFMVAKLASMVIFRHFELKPEINAAAVILLTEPDLVRALVIAIGAALVAPITEEILFRGVLYSALRKRLGPGVGILLSSVIFAIVHPPTDWFAIFILAVVLAGVYEKTGSLVAPIAMHAANNAYGVALLLTHRYLMSA